MRRQIESPVSVPFVCNLAWNIVGVDSQICARECQKHNELKFKQGYPLQWRNKQELF